MNFFGVDKSILGIHSVDSIVAFPQCYLAYSILWFQILSEIIIHYPLLDYFRGAASAIRIYAIFNFYGFFFINTCLAALRQHS